MTVTIDDLSGLLERARARAHCASGSLAPPDGRCLATMIDHTVLKPETAPDVIRKLCDEAREYGFASACVNPCWVRLAAERLAGSGVKVCSVAGFPLGASCSAIKADEARQAIADGAGEVDMVLNIGALKARDDEYVYRDILGVVAACRSGGAICKVIIEAVLLSDEEKVRATRSVVRAQADFVKTSTGFSAGGATVADVALLAETVSGTTLGVKASGGIRSMADALRMIAAGATRIGTSAGVQIVREAAGQGGAAAPGAY